MGALGVVSVITATALFEKQITEGLEAFSGNDHPEAFEALTTCGHEVVGRITEDPGSAHPMKLTEAKTVDDQPYWRSRGELATSAPGSKAWSYVIEAQTDALSADGLYVQVSLQSGVNKEASKEAPTPTILLAGTVTNLGLVERITSGTVSDKEVAEALIGAFNTGQKQGAAALKFGMLSVQPPKGPILTLEIDQRKVPRSAEMIQGTRPYPSDDPQYSTVLEDLKRACTNVLAQTR